MAAASPADDIELCVVCGEAPIAVRDDKIGFCTACHQATLNEFLRIMKTRPIKYDPPTRITDKIFIGNMDSATSKEKLDELGITHVLVVGKYLDKHISSGIAYMHLEVDDSLEQDLTPHFLPAVDFINAHEGAALVHCHAGMSRSGAMLLAYLMHTNRWTFDTALEFVKAKYPKISPNSNFVRQLKEIETHK